MDFERMRYDSPYREFPLLVPQFPDNLADLTALHRRWPLLRGELVRARLLYKAVIGAPRKKRRRVFVAYYRDIYPFPANINYNRSYKRFVGYVRLAGQFIKELIREYFWNDPFGKTLVSRETDDPVELLCRCFQKVNDAEGRKRVFEARRKLVLAQLLFEISTSQHRDDLLDHDMKLLTGLLEQSFFTGRTEEILVRSVHNPYREFQTEKILDESEAPPPGTHLIEKPLVFRFFRSFGEELPVYFEAGVKRSFSHLEKMLRKGIRDPDEIKDLRRYLLVFRNEWEMRRGLRVLREKVHNAPGVIHDHSSNMWSEGPADRANPHSSPAFRQKKFVVLLDGRRVEGMVQTLPEYLNGKYARNGKNHALYKLRQRFSSTFPIGFPAVHYGRNWDDPAVEEKKSQEILARNHD